MAAESPKPHGIESYLTRGVHLPNYLLNMLEPYMPHRIIMPKDQILLRIADKVAFHQTRGETSELPSGLVVYRTTSRPLVAVLTDFERDFRLYHFSHEFDGKYPDNAVPFHLGEGVTVIDGVLKLVTKSPRSELPLSQELPDGFVHARETTHTRVVALGTLHDLGIK